MVVRFRKKVKRQRGNRWHGWGGKKKHRGKGSKGGSGMAGSRKHKRSYIYAKKLDYFGKRGFTSLKEKGRSINVENLARLAGKETEIDLSKLGYQKLLGRGNVTRSFTVNVKEASKSAIEKIEAAGGKIITGQENGEKKEVVE